MHDEPVIHAAGCVLWRRSPSGDGIELALVHRPRRADWSYPKGKLNHGEDARQAAEREVLEETGMACHLGSELPPVRYQVDGCLKEVRYWAAEAAGGAFEPNDEVDRMVWLPPAQALMRVTHDADRELVSTLVSALGGSVGAG